MTEAIVNGGFESALENPSICWDGTVNRNSSNQHSGSWSCFLYSSSIWQVANFVAPVTDITIFGFWHKGNGGDASVNIHYTDTTETDVEIPNVADWTYLDLTGYLVAGKTVENIKLNGGSGNPIYVDDVTLIYIEATPVTVVTNAATAITSNSALLNGEITDLGSYVHADERGFEWGTSTGVYPNSWTETGSFGIEAFSHTIDLSGETIIYFRAKVYDGANWTYGSELTFSPYRIIITNAGGTLYCDATGWEEEQTCKPAIRDVIKDSNGSVVDTGTYVISNRVLEFVIRISDAQLTTLNAIFAQNAVVTITAKTEMTDYPRWTYVAWFAKPLKRYEYKKEGSIEREWNVQLTLYCSSYTYAVSA